MYIVIVNLCIIQDVNANTIFNVKKKMQFLKICFYCLCFEQSYRDIKIASINSHLKNILSSFLEKSFKRESNERLRAWRCAKLILICLVIKIKIKIKILLSRNVYCMSYIIVIYICLCLYFIAIVNEILLCRYNTCFDVWILVHKYNCKKLIIPDMLGT